VALSVVSLASISLSLSQYELSISMLIFIFCIALFAYNFIKFFPIIREITNHDFPYIILLLSLLCLLLSLYLFIQLTFLSKIVVVTGGILVLLYTFPMNKGLNNLRNTKGWKVYLVVLTWVLITVCLPFLSTTIFDIRLFIQLVLIQGIYIFVAILPFDIRDLDSDSKCLNTIPQKLGVSKSKILGYVLLFVNSIFTIICFDFISPMSLSSITSFILLAFLLKLSYPNKSKYLSSLWVESIPFFWAGSFYLFT
tara:strand:- start:133 stop:891 length:759 start_codon:yes stop_codon:yes gene_type:complete